MSSSSENSLAELPLPYDISSAVSRALHMDSMGGAENVYSKRSLSYPSGYYDFPAHNAATSAYSGVSSEGESYPAAAYYCPTSNPYFYSMPNSAAAVTCTDPQQYLYPHHYHHSTIIHPSEVPQVQMEVEAWSDSTTISICNNSSDELLESQANIEQLDQFCKYIDSSGDEELIVADKTENQIMLGSMKNDYGCYVTDGSPPKRERKNTCTMSLPSSSYFEDDAEELRSWKVELENRGMWREFDGVGTEMVITKAGRRMFPTLSLKVCGLNQKETYSVKLDILPADNRRYKYLQSEWVAVGRSDKKQVYCEYEHPDSPNSGGYWMDKTIAFKMVKLTNNKNTRSSDQIILNSMHKYLPCVKIICRKDGYTQNFTFHETSFIAVTAYQSTGVTQLKINNNPYARAFRESVPSSGSQKSGGHFGRNSFSGGNSLSPDRLASGSQKTTPISSPRHRIKTKPKVNCNSTVSVESGFESDTAGERRKDSVSILQANPFPSTSLVTYWGTEDNRLWNPNLITPDPLIPDTSGSFSSTYLDDGSRGSGYGLKDAEERCHSAKTSLDVLPEPGMELTVEATIQVDDDVFF